MNRNDEKSYLKTVRVLATGLGKKKRLHYCYIMVRVFPKSENHQSEMRLTIYNSVSCYCFPLTGD